VAPAAVLAVALVAAQAAVARHIMLRLAGAAVWVVVLALVAVPLVTQRAGPA
jgi:hypothetical protein